jgi:hypothetical protein
MFKHFNENGYNWENGNAVAAYDVDFSCTFLPFCTGNLDG